MMDRNEQLLSGFQYAMRIQNALLPPNEALAEAIPEHFLIFKPKHMVSSDFYWFGETDAAYFLVVGDCAGHAVAGALMSIIASRLLNAIILKNNIQKPVAILEAMHEGLKDILKLKYNEDASIKIDLSICRLARHRRRVTFVGARRPLYWIQKRKNGLRSKSLKGDRYPVGGRNPAPPFTTHHLELEAGDMLYLTTDGYTLQKGKNGSKYGILKLNKQLQAISSLPVSQQKNHLIEAFNTHRGDEEQTDDITFIGVQF